MKIPDDRRAVHHGFSFKRENQAQDTMSTGMLRPHIENHFLSFETFSSFYILSDCPFILICNHGFLFVYFNLYLDYEQPGLYGLCHLARSLSHEQQFAQTHTKTK